MIFGRGVTGVKKPIAHYAKTAMISAAVPIVFILIGWYRHSHGYGDSDPSWAYLPEVVFSTFFATWWLILRLAHIREEGAPETDGAKKKQMWSLVYSVFLFGILFYTGFVLTGKIPVAYLLQTSLWQRLYAALPVISWLFTFLGFFFALLLMGKRPVPRRMSELGTTVLAVFFTSAVMAAGVVSMSPPWLLTVAALVISAGAFFFSFWKKRKPAPALAKG